MIGTFTVFTAFVCFAVTFPPGLLITLFSFWKISRRDNSGRILIPWLWVSAGTFAVLFVLTVLTSDFGDKPQPSAEGYKAMIRTLVLWAMIPGAALAAGGVANLIRASRLPAK